MLAMLLCDRLAHLWSAVHWLFCTGEAKFVLLHLRFMCALPMCSSTICAATKLGFTLIDRCTSCSRAHICAGPLCTRKPSYAVTGV
jgi:hypothetical protein